MIRDIYDTMPSEIGVALRRNNQERLALLEATAAEREARMARIASRYEKSSSPEKEEAT